MQRIREYQAVSGQEASSSDKQRYPAIGVTVLLLIAALGILLTLQGWRSRALAFDLIPHYENARNFLEDGTLPQRGDTGSYGSYKPPGTAWLMLPSAVLFNDPRLSEYVGTGLLYLATLVGIFWLAKEYFGVRCAYLAVVLYALSEHALFWAGSLWPNGRPDFYILTVVFTSLWVIRRDAKFLAAAVGIWAVAMNVDMGIAPAVLILPAAWLYYRPPVRLNYLLFAGVVALLVWYPYLDFQASRDFTDIRSQLLQQHIGLGDYTAAWCDPDLTLVRLEDAPNATVQPPTPFPLSENQASAGLHPLLTLFTIGWKKLLSNFVPVAPVPGASVALLFLTLGSVVLLSTSASSDKRAEAPRHPRSRRNLFVILAVAMILAGVLASEFIVARILPGNGTLPASVMFSIQRWQKLLLVSGVSLLVIPLLAATVNRFLTMRGIQIQRTDMAEKTKLLAFSLLIPWLILVVVAEPGKPERFWWLWPLQLIFLAAFTTNILPRLGVSRMVVPLVQLLFVIVILGNPFLLSRVESWAADGWAGSDAEEVQVVDYVARQLAAEGRDRAAIGYQTFIFPFMANYNITNPQYKVGAELDLLFKYRHGIVNTNRCAEGVATNDEYRIVQTMPKSPEWAPKEYFDVPLDSRFRPVGDVALYQVFKRTDSLGAAIEVRQ